MALDAFRKDTFDLVLSDIVMPEMDGLKLLAELRNDDPDVPVIMVTAMHDISIALEAIRAGAYDYILKPFEKDQLHLSVRRALEHRRLVMENRTYQSDLEHLVAERTQQLSIALQDLEQSYDYTLEALGGALDAKDAETEGHCQRVTAFTITIARSMGVDKGLLRHIARGAFLHDIGKMGVPDRSYASPALSLPKSATSCVSTAKSASRCWNAFHSLRRPPKSFYRTRNVLTAPVTRVDCAASKSPSEPGFSRSRTLSMP